MTERARFAWALVMLSGTMMPVAVEGSGEVISRAQTVMNESESSLQPDHALSRGFTVLNSADHFMLFDEVTSRPHTIQNQFDGHLMNTDAVSRAVTVEPLECAPDSGSVLWRSVSLVDGTFDIYLRSTAIPLEPPAVLVPPLAGIDGIYVLKQPHDVPVDGATAIRAIAIAQSAAHLERHDMNELHVLVGSSPIRGDVLADYWTGRPFWVYFPANAGESAVDIQVRFGLFLILPSLRDHSHRREIYKRLFVEALMQAQPEFTEQFTYIDGHGQARSESVPSQIASLLQLADDPSVKGSLEYAGLIQKVLSATTAERVPHTLPNLDLLIYKISTDPEFARLGGFGWTVGSTRTTYQQSPLIRRLGPILDALKLVRDMTDAGGKFLVYHLFAASHALKRAAKVDEVLGHPGVASLLNERDSAILEGWALAKSEVEAYSEDFMTGSIDAIREGLGPSSLRILEGRLFNKILAVGGPASGALAYITWDTWKVIFDDRHTFQYATCAATLSELLRQAEDFPANGAGNWRTEIVDLAQLVPEPSVERAYDYVAFRAALGYAFFDRTVKYYAPNGVMEHFLLTWGILERPYPVYNVEWEQGRQRCVNALRNTRPVLYRSWTAGLFDQTPEYGGTVLSSILSKLTTASCQPSILPGAISITLGPPEVVDVGAFWRLLNAADSRWQTSGSMVTGLPPQAYLAEFSPVPGWVQPTDRPFMVVAGQTTVVEGVYVRNDVEVSGTIRDSGGSGVGGVALYTNDFVTPVMSLPDGSYSIARPLQWSGRVTPSKAGLTFLPPSREYSGLPGDATHQDYQAVRLAVTVSGFVWSDPGIGVPAVTVAATGSGVVLTGDDGQYTLSVPAGWNGKITPGRAGWSMFPTDRSYAFLSVDIYHQDFWASLSMDCNSNSIDDELDVLHSASLDCNGNVVPDECESIREPDYDNDGRFTLRDARFFLSCLSGPAALPANSDAACNKACLAACDKSGEHGRSAPDGDVDLADFGRFALTIGTVGL